MTSDQAADRVSSQLADALPYLRRHARALTGSQTSGDELALATLELVLENSGIVRGASTPKIGFFKAFAQAWTKTGANFALAETGIAATTQKHLVSLTPRARQALLLHTIEEFGIEEMSEVLSCSHDETSALLDTARAEIAQSVAGRIMVIEDEAMIAMDLQDIVVEMGHDVVGAAVTRDQAVALALSENPDLILSDIQLADGSSGVDAIDDILRAAADTPVIFITAFPERLLTGERNEPAFVITKPYSKTQIQSAVGQAMFFRSSRAISV